MSNIKLSFILPCYNVEKYIAECLDSLYVQDIPEEEYEVICVNDCSPDGTRDIIIDYQQKHPNLILIDHEINKKQGAARNTGTKAAKGEYVWFVDPDDYVTANCLQLIITKAMQSRLDILQFNVEITDKAKFPDFDSSNLKQESIIQTGKAYLQMIMNIHWGRTVEVWRRVYNRDFLNVNHIFFPESFNVGEDAVFFYQSILKCERHKQITDYLYTYRVDNVNSTMNLTDRSGIKLADRFISLNEIIKLLYNSDLEPSSFKEKCISSYVWAVKRLRRKIIKLSYKERKLFYEKVETADKRVLKLQTSVLENTLFIYPIFSKVVLFVVSPTFKLIYKIK
jgi:glycosyltransferase involved in cell wall biosynthesis